MTPHFDLWLCFVEFNAFYFIVCSILSAFCLYIEMIFNKRCYKFSYKSVKYVES